MRLQELKEMHFLCRFTGALCLHGKGLQRWLLKKLPELSPHLAQPVPADSRMDSSLPKAWRSHWKASTGGSCDPKERKGHVGAGLVAGIVTSRCSLFLDSISWNKPTLKLKGKTATFRNSSHWRSLWRTVSHGREPMLEQWNSVRRPPPEEEGDGILWTDHRTHFLAPGQLVERKERKLAGINLRKKGRVGERCV